MISTTICPSTCSASQGCCRSSQIKAGTIRIHCHVTDYIKRCPETGYTIDNLKHSWRIGLDIDYENRILTCNKQVAFIRIERQSCGLMRQRQFDQIDTRRHWIGVSQAQSHCVNNRDTRIRGHKNTRSVGSSNSIDNSLPDGDLLDDLFRT